MSYVCHIAVWSYVYPTAVVRSYTLLQYGHVYPAVVWSYVYPTAVWYCVYPTAVCVLSIYPILQYGRMYILLSSISYV